MPASMNAVNFSMTPWGRLFLHTACLCRHPAAARFFLAGVKRNLSEWLYYRAHRRGERTVRRSS